MILLDFHATWCEPCKWAEPIIDLVIEELGDVVMLEKVDVDQEPERAKAHRVLSVPTFILMDGQREVWRMRGFDTAPKMINEIRNAIDAR